jgi:hypothetical protein
MNTFIDILFTFIFLFTMFFFEIPDLNNDNYLNHKLIIFVSLFMFNYLSKLLKKMRNHCKIIQQELIDDSLYLSLFGVLGYSLFVDLKIMTWSKNLITSMYSSVFSLNIIVAITITLMVTIVKVFRLVFYNTPDTCIKLK